MQRHKTICQTMNIRISSWFLVRLSVWVVAMWCVSQQCLSQRLAQAMRYDGRWQVQLLKGKMHTQSVSLDEAEQNRYRSLLRNNTPEVSFIENMLTSGGLPKMLRNLAMIESGFTNHSISHAGAVGMWQIMPIHAEQYGISAAARTDVYLSTRVAIRSLKDLYQKYGNWVAVIAAYNCGAGALDKAINRAKSSKFDEFYPFLPDETINHVLKFMAACHVTDELQAVVEDYRKRFGGANAPLPQRPKREKPNNDPTMTAIDLTADYNLQVLMAELGVDEGQLTKWSPHLQDDLTTYGAGTLFLPISKMAEFHTKKATILKRSKKQ